MTDTETGVWLGKRAVLRDAGCLNASMTIVMMTRHPEGTRIISNFYIFQIKSTFSDAPGFFDSCVV